MADGKLMVPQDEYSTGLLSLNFMHIILVTSYLYHSTFENKSINSSHSLEPRHLEFPSRISNEIGI